MEHYRLFHNHETSIKSKKRNSIGYEKLQKQKYKHHQLPAPTHGCNWGMAPALIDTAQLGHCSSITETTMILLISYIYKTSLHALHDS